MFFLGLIPRSYLIETIEKFIIKKFGHTKECMLPGLKILKVFSVLDHRFMNYVGSQEARSISKLLF